MASSISSRILIGTGWLTGWRLVNRLLGFISLLVLSQILVPADFGLIAMASAIAAGIEAVSQVGVKDALVRLRDDSTDFYDTAFTFQVARGLFTGFVIAVSAFVSNATLGDARLRPILFLLASLSIISGFENIGVVQLARTLDFRTQVLLQAIPRLLGFFATIAVALLLRSYWSLLAGLVVTRLLSGAFSYAAVPHRPRLSLRGWRYIFRFSFWIWASSIAVFVWSRSDPFILGPTLGPSLLGLYVISYETACLPITELIEPISGAIYPGFAMAHRSSGVPATAAFNVAGVLALFALPFAIGISACSGYLTTGLLGPAWAGAQPIIAVVTWLCVFSPFSYVCGSVLVAQGHIRRAFFCNAAAAAAKVAVLLVASAFTRDVATIAASNATVIILESTLFLWQARRVGNHGARPLLYALLRAVPTALLTAGVLACLPYTWAPVPLGRTAALILGGLIGLLGFAVFFLSHAAVWLASGRPDGPEAMAWRQLRPLLRHIAPAQHPDPAP